MPADLVALLLAVVAGLATAWVGRRWVRPWLARGGHRYEDEVDLPPRRLGWFAPTTALVVGVVTGAQAMQDPAYAIVAGSVTAVLMVLVAIDADVHRLPDVFTLPMLLAVPLALGLVALVTGDLGAWVASLIGGLALGAMYVVLFLVALGRGMGLGDVKLAPSLGALLGYLSYVHIVAATMLCFLAAGAFAAVLLLRRRANRKTMVAFGPFMVLGTVVVLGAPLLVLGAG